MARTNYSLQPLYPKRSDGFRRQADRLVREASRLSGMLAPETRTRLSDLIALMNSYYSNLIEGHYTYPRDIERGLAEQWSTDPAARDYQAEAVAHVEVDREVRRALRDDPALDPASPAFLRWVHAAFYERLPERFRTVESATGESATVAPGEYRTQGVMVGRHAAPDSDDLDRLMRAFGEGYCLDRLHHPEDLAAVFGAHHRLLWIHPFTDGNGRVARIMTQAHLHRLGLAGEGLWSLSRGLARADDRYRKSLAAADAGRHDMTDGRGNLTDRGLASLCDFMVEVAVDQVAFMTEALELETLEARIRRFVERDPDLKPEVADLLRDVAVRGKVPRGEVPRLLALPERTARDVTRRLLDRGLVEAESHRAPLTLGLPTDAAEMYFRRLFPAGLE